MSQIEEEEKENEYNSSDKSSENKDNEEMDINFLVQGPKCSLKKSIAKEFLSNSSKG